MLSRKPQPYLYYPPPPKPIPNNRVTRRNFETLKIQTHKHKKEREKSQNRRGEKKTQSSLKAMESFKYNDCDMNRKGIEHLQIECPFGVGKRERVRSWTLLGSVPVRK